MKFDFYNLTEHDWHFVGGMLGMVLPADLKGYLVFDNETNVAAVVALHNWTNNSVDATWIIQNPLVLRHGLFEDVYNYVFVENNRKYIIGRIASDKPKSLKLAAHLGMEEIAVIKDGQADGVDMHMLTLSKEQVNKGRWFNRSAA